MEASESEDFQSAAQASHAQMHQEQAHALIEEFSFGILVSEGLQTTHLPFLLNRNEGECGVAAGLRDSDNPQARQLWRYMQDIQDENSMKPLEPR